MGHPHSESTPVSTDNNTANGLTMVTMTSKASKSNDMRSQWLKFHKAQRLFAFLWARGPNNRADYPIKHHHGPHHLHVRQNYVVDKNSAITANYPPPPMYLYIHQVTLYIVNCVTFFILFYFFFSLSQIFSNGLVRQIYLQGCADLPT